MGFAKLPQESINAFRKIFEVKMDLQVGRKPNGPYVLVIAGHVALNIDAQLTEQMSTYREIVARRDATSEAEIEKQMEAWIATLPLSDPIESVPFDEALQAVGLLHLGPITRLPPAPWRPSYVYGHLPFHGLCSGNEVFYRFESMPKGWRIDRKTGEVKGKDIYAAPMSDLPLVPSGLSAVSRYALPSLLPARWRYELRPPAGTPIRYGASVPLYGQSGGGVEVMFPHPFQNVGHIADPVLLPVL